MPGACAVLDVVGRGSLLPSPEEEEPEAEAPRGSSRSTTPGARSRAATPSAIRRQEEKGLTGCRSEFGTLNMSWSLDPIMNMRAATASRLMCHKWKMFVRLVLIKEAHRAEAVRWRRNPRWMARVASREAAWVWGHYGGATQYLRRAEAEALFRSE